MIEIDSDASRDMMMRLLAGKGAVVRSDGEQVHVAPPTRDKQFLLMLAPFTMLPDDLDWD